MPEQYISITNDEYKQLCERSKKLAQIEGAAPVWATSINQSIALNFPEGHATLQHVADSLLTLPE